MLVKQVMSTGVLTVSPSDQVRAVVERMLARHCGAVPVVEGADGTLVGVVAIRDVLLPLYPPIADYVHDNVSARDFIAMERAYVDLLACPVSQIMTRHPLTVAPDDPVLKAASYMGLRQLRRIPVVEQGRLVGMISIGDINRELFLSSRRNDPHATEDTG